VRILVALYRWNIDQKSNFHLDKHRCLKIFVSCRYLDCLRICPACVLDTVELQYSIAEWSLFDIPRSKLHFPPDVLIPVDLIAY